MRTRGKVRVAVVGQGPIGRLHAKIYSSLESCELVAVCDRIPELASSGKEQFGVPGFERIPEMLNAVDPDMVSVATGGFEYSRDHFEPVMLALEHGSDVLCEKPISNEIGTAREMVAKAGEKGLRFGIDFNHRFTPAAYAAKSWMTELGDPLFGNVALWIGRFGDFETREYHLKALCPHSVNLMEWLLGPVESVQCFAMSAPGRDLWSTASINLKFANGAVGHITSSYDIARAHSVERCEVAGTGGRIVIDEMWRSATFFPAGSREQKVYANPVFGGFRDFDDTFRERLSRFIEQVSAGASPEEIDGSGAEGLSAQVVIHAAIRSLNEGNRAVSVSEI